MSRLAHAALALGAVSCLALGQTAPTGFTVDLLLQSGLTNPIDFAFLPDGRALIAGKTGVLHLYANNSVVTIGTVPNVETTGLVEKGMLSVEVDPMFVNNGYVYVWYCSTQDSFMHLDRFELLGNRNSPTATNLTLSLASRRTVLDAVPDYAPHHNGGTLRFGPDGMLYLTIGDDDIGCDAQVPAEPRGKLLRMNVAGLAAGGSLVAPSFSALDPGNNPLSSGTDFRQLVIGVGLRNPFRMHIDQVTGDIYVGDVGGDLVEEIDEYRYAPGTLPLRNYGWPWYEGASVRAAGCSTSSQPVSEMAVASAPHAAGWNALILGPRYRNQGGIYDFGPSYEDSIFAADYYGGVVRRFVPNGSVWAMSAPVPGQPGPANWGEQYHAVTAMRIGPDGAIYATHDVGWWAGLFTRTRPTAPVPVVAAVSGGGQIVAAREPFPQPLRVRVATPTGAPLAGVPVTFTLTGPAVSSVSAPVLSDAQGYAQIDVQAANAGGAVTVSATAPNASGTPTFSLFVRKITATPSPTVAVVDIVNSTAATPALVPYVIMAGLPGAQPWASPIGTFCSDPASPLTIILEDGLGVRGGITLSGQGGIGNPSLTRVYQLVPGLLNGLRLQFQAVGWDAQTGLFLTDCASAQF